MIAPKRYNRYMIGIINQFMGLIVLGNGIGYIRLESIAVLAL